MDVKNGMFWLMKGVIWVSISREVRETSLWMVKCPFILRGRSMRVKKKITECYAFLSLSLSLSFFLCRSCSPSFENHLSMWVQFGHSSHRYIGAPLIPRICKDLEMLEGNFFEGDKMQHLVSRTCCSFASSERKEKKLKEGETKREMEERCEIRD